MTVKELKTLLEKFPEEFTVRIQLNGYFAEHVGKLSVIYLRNEVIIHNRK